MGVYVGGGYIITIPSIDRNNFIPVSGCGADQSPVAVPTSLRLRCRPVSGCGADQSQIGVTTSLRLRCRPVSGWGDDQSPVAVPTSLKLGWRPVSGCGADQSPVGVTTSLRLRCRPVSGWRDEQFPVGVTNVILVKRWTASGCKTKIRANRGSHRFAVSTKNRIGRRRASLTWWLEAQLTFIASWWSLLSTSGASVVVRLASGTSVRQVKTLGFVPVECLVLTIDYWGFSHWTSCS